MYVTIIAYHPMLEPYNQTSCHKLKPFRLTVEFSSKRSQTISFPNHISILLSSNKTQYQNVFIEREKRNRFVDIIIYTEWKKLKMKSLVKYFHNLSLKRFRKENKNSNKIKANSSLQSPCLFINLFRKINQKSKLESKIYT